MSKKTKSTPKKAEAKKAEGPKPRRWSIGCYRDRRGGLSTVYVKVDGTVMPSLADRVGDAEILHHNTFTDMTYAEARAALVAEAVKAGYPEQVETEPQAKAAESEPTKGKAKKKAGRGRAKKKK